MARFNYTACRTAPKKDKPPLLFVSQTYWHVQCFIKNTKTSTTEDFLSEQKALESSIRGWIKK